MNEFILDNFSFITNTVSIFVCLLAAWLIWDSTTIKDDNPSIYRVAGFLILMFAFIVKQLFLTSSGVTPYLYYLFMSIGLFVIFLGVKQEKINPVPDTKKMRSVSPLVLLFQLILPLVNVILSFTVSFLLYRRYKKGLVKEYRSLYYAFFLLGISFLFEALLILNISNNVILNQVTKLYGPVWFFGVFFQFVAIMALSVWVYRYLRFRIYPLLFSGISVIVVFISIFSAFVYSLFLLSNAESDFLEQIRINAKSVELNISNAEDGALTTAKLISINESIVKYLDEKDYDNLSSTTNFLSDTAQDIDTIVVTDKSGIVVVDTDDELEVGKSINGELLVNRALAFGDSNVSLITEDGVSSPKLKIEAISPVIKNNRDIIGTVKTIVNLDNAYADAIKDQINLDVIIFVDNVRSATTFVDEVSSTRLLSLSETNGLIINKVLEGGEAYLGETEVQNIPYYSAYLPLYDVRQQPVGMIFVGRERSLLTQTTREANYNTFVISLLVALVSMIPAKMLADYIYRNYRA